MPPASTNPRDTPAMRQYTRFKQQYPGTILLFRIGDFYEMFDDDAVTAHKALGLTLTQRQSGIPLAGVPYHQLETYLRRFIAQGFRVAVCEQTQDAAEAKGVVERAVTRVLTPGTLVDESLLSDDRANTLGAVAFGDNNTAALATAELSTGQFSVLVCRAEQVADELARRACTELLYAETADGKPPPRLAAAFQTLGIAGTPQPQWHFRADESRESLCELFKVKTLAGFGLPDGDPLIAPAGAIVRYLHATQMPDAGEAAASKGRRAGGLAHLRPPKREAVADHLLIDAASLRSLEIDRTIRTSIAGAISIEGSLLGVFTAPGGRPLCRGAMGKRLLRDWLCRPSVDLETIESRQRCVALLVEDRRLAKELGTLLESVQDIHRIGARVALGRSTPRDLVALGGTLGLVDGLLDLLVNAPAFAGHRKSLATVRDALVPVAERIRSMCVDEPPAHLREGGIIRTGVDALLDESRTLRAGANTWLAEYQKKLIDEHQLPSLKVGFNKVFGYFIELPKAQAQRAPAAFSRRQTLTGAERYITPELKDFEDKVTHAHARAVTREQELFDDLCAAAAAQLESIQRFGIAAAELDVLLCFAEKATQRGWTRPTVTTESGLEIHGGRHPVLEVVLGRDFVPNDLQLGVIGKDADNAASLALITGPNMAGKSTFIRQTALIVLLAHTGSFVPADSAIIGLCDRIFTRVGADDALFAGQSTFMVEMTETANILHNATPRSLVILDEIGRGTSTLDGLSLAWAITERLATEDGPRTLFATHYHELTQLEEQLPGRVKNLQVAVREWEDQVVFLHRITPGRADQSYGVHVAKLAGIPESVVSRARQVLASLSVQHEGVAQEARPSGRGQPKVTVPPPDSQLGLFTEYVPHPAVDALGEVKLDHLTPIQAFDELRKLKSLLDSKRD
ncbi:MAG: DNA mismatch repair protein MutS [Phycisphaerales bacterium]